MDQRRMQQTQPQNQQQPQQNPSQQQSALAEVSRITLGAKEPNPTSDTPESDIDYASSPSEQQRTQQQQYKNIKSVGPAALQNLSDYKLFFLMNTAMDRRALIQPSTSTRNQPKQQQRNRRRQQQQQPPQPQPQPQELSTILSYDLQRSLFDDLTADQGQLKEQQSANKTDANEQAPSIWERSSRLVLDTFKFITFQQQSSKQTANTYSTIAAMANDDDINPAAIAYAAAYAIALSSIDGVVQLTEKEREASKAKVTAAKTIKTSEDAIKFNDTVGLQSLVKAANALQQSDRASALTCLANVAIVLPKARKQMLLVKLKNNDLVMTSLLIDVLLDTGLDIDDSSLWFVEALVSSIHLLGSLALGKGPECRRFRARMARDAQIVHRLEKLSYRLSDSPISSDAPKGIGPPQDRERPAQFLQ